MTLMANCMNFTGMNIMGSEGSKLREKKRETMIVKLKDKNPEYPDFTPDQPYFFIGIEADDYRIINDFGKPYI